MGLASRAGIAQQPTPRSGKRLTAMKGLSALIVSQLVVTLALLGFAFAQEDATKALIVGAVIGHWLKEGTHLGQQVSEMRSARADKTIDTTESEP